MKKFFRILGLIWTYITIILFAIYGSKLLQNESINKAFPIIVFVICGIYFILSTVFYALVFNSQKKVYKNDLKKVKKFFSISSKIIKLSIILIPIISITSDGFSWSLKGTKFFTIIYIIWASMTLIFELLKFALRKAFQK